jgi:hypothetical protein
MSTSCSDDLRPCIDDVNLVRAEIVGRELAEGDLFSFFSGGAREEDLGERVNRDDLCGGGEPSNWTYGEEGERLNRRVGGGESLADWGVVGAC